MSRYAIPFLVVAVFVSCASVRPVAQPQPDTNVITSPVPPASAARPSATAELRRSGPPFVGATAYDWFAQGAWGNPKASWPASEPLHTLSASGIGWLEARVTTRSTPELESIPRRGSPWRDEFWCSREYAMQVLRAGAAQGMKLHALLFLSDVSAHAGKQKAPAGWEAFTLEQTAAALQQHGFETARYFSERGLKIELYSIGNEIEFGVTGFSYDGRLRTPGIDVFRNFAWLRANIWPKEAVLLKAAIAGVKEAEPAAEIALHVSVPRHPDLVHAFYQAMVDFGVPFDYASFSDYPWLNYHPEVPSPPDYLELSVRAASDLGKLSLIGEFSFPAGPVATTLPVVPQAGYPFTEGGQAAWIRDYLERLSRISAVVGAYYFYPDNFLTDQGAAALFRDVSTTTAGLAAIAEFQRSRK